MRRTELIASLNIYYIAFTFCVKIYCLIMHAYRFSIEKVGYNRDSEEKWSTWIRYYSCKINEGNFATYFVLWLLPQRYTLQICRY